MTINNMTTEIMEKLNRDEWTISLENSKGETVKQSVVGLAQGFNGKNYLIFVANHSAGEQRLIAEFGVTPNMDIYLTGIPFIDGTSKHCHELISNFNLVARSIPDVFNMDKIHYVVWKDIPHTIEYIENGEPVNKEFKDDLDLFEDYMNSTDWKFMQLDGIDTKIVEVLYTELGHILIHFNALLSDNDIHEYICRTYTTGEYFGIAPYIDADIVEKYGAVTETIKNPYLSE